MLQRFETMARVLRTTSLAVVTNDQMRGFFFSFFFAVTRTAAGVRVDEIVVLRVEFGIRINDDP